jgi:hypothetical protein
MQQHKLSLTEIIILLSGCLLLLLVVIILRKPFFFDEISYTQNIWLFEQYGFSTKYVTSLTGSAGPLYGVFHYFFKPVTAFDPVKMRLLNVACFGLVIFFITKCLQQLKTVTPAYALYAFAIPMSYVLTGMVLTEMPALLCVSAGIYLLLSAQRDTKNYLQIPSLVAGCLLLSIGTCGRQNYLVLVVAMPALFFPFTKRSVFLCLLSIAITVAMPLYIFYVWQGLVPPSDATFYLPDSNQFLGLRPEFFCLSLFYFAVVMVLIAPAFYQLSLKKYSMAIMVVCIVITVFNYYNNIAFLPVRTIAEKILKVPAVIKFTGSFFATAIFVVAIIFLANSLLHLIKRFKDNRFVFLMIAALVIAASVSKVTWGFSSRYPAQAIPFLVLVGSYFYKPLKWNIYLVVAGVVTGIISLVSFYLTH